MSDALLWELTKTNSSFLVKRDGLQLSSDPLNVANVHAFKYSGVNKKVRLVFREPLAFESNASKY